MADNANRFEEAEAAYRKAIGLDPAYALSWNILGRLLEAQGRLEEVSAAYARGAELNQDLHPFWKEKHANLQTRICTDAARHAVETGNQPALRVTLSRLLAESADIVATLVSTQFVESFLAPLL